MTDSQTSLDSFGARGSLRVGETEYEIYRLGAVPDLRNLPYSLKVLLENLLRTEDGANVTAEQIRALAGVGPAGRARPRDPVHPGPGDHAGLHRRAVRRRPGHHARGGPRPRRRPGQDQPAGPGRAGHRPLGHRRRLRPRRTPSSATSTSSTSATASATSSCAGGRARSTSSRSCRRAPASSTRSTSSTSPAWSWCAATRGPPTRTPASAPTRTPRWSTASASSAGASAASRPRRPCSASRCRMLIPRVVGFRLTGQLPEGATATDLVLTITEMLRRHGVVGKFVEFYGDGVAAVPLANRATIGNMSPEFGSTCAIFPIDDETVAVPAVHRPARPSRSRWSRRTPASRVCGTTRRASRCTPSTSSSTWRPSCRRSPARGGRRTGSRWPTPRWASAPRSPSYARAAAPDATGAASTVDEAGEESFPASDSPAPSGRDGVGRDRRTSTPPPRRVPTAGRAVPCG